MIWTFWKSTTPLTHPARSHPATLRRHHPIRISRSVSVSFRRWGWLTEYHPNAIEGPPPAGGERKMAWRGTCIDTAEAIVFTYGTTVLLAAWPRCRSCGSDALARLRGNKSPAVVGARRLWREWEVAVAVFPACGSVRVHAFAEVCRGTLLVQVQVLRPDDGEDTH
jgi:hypothetical protein